MLKSGNDYLVAVKGNQPSLYEHLQTFERHLKPLAQATEETRARGRHEYRQVNVYHPSGIDEEQWVGVKSILCVKRWGTRKGTDYEHQTYYLSSVSTSPQRWQLLVRGHWGIENRLHWPKDKVLGEDDYRIEEPNALLNWSIIRSIAINILRLNGYQSLKSALTKLANRVDVIFSLLT